MVNILHTILDPYILGGFLLYAITLMVLCIYFWRHRNFLASLMLVYFIFCSTIIINAYIFNINLITPDAEYVFLPSAQKVINFLDQGLFSAILDYGKLRDLNLNIPFYTIPLGTVLFFFQGSFIAGHLFSTIFGILIIYQLYHITFFLYDKRTAQFAALLWTASPFFNWISILIMRDTFGLFLILWFFRLWQLYEIKGDSKYLYLILFNFMCNLLLRPPMAVVLFTTVISYRIFGIQSNKSIFFRILKFAGISVLAALILFKILSGMIDTDSLLLKGLKYAELETINKRAAESFEAGSTYLEVGMYKSYTDLLKYWPLLIFYFLCSPLPWQIKKPRHAFALIDSTVLWFLYGLFLFEIWQFKKRNNKWGVIFLSYLLLGISSASLLQGNVGGAQRHRILFTAIMIPFAAHRLLVILDKSGIFDSFKMIFQQNLFLGNKGKFSA